MYLKSARRYVLGKRSLSCTRFRENFIHCLKDLRYDEKLYGLHSFRAGVGGGGTTVTTQKVTASNKERLLRLHGRWKTDICKDMYIKGYTTDTLTVSKCMGTEVCK